MFPSFSLLTPLLAAVYVSAHGFLYQITIDGTLYEGNQPRADARPSVIRQIDSIDPVQPTSNPYINCGQNAQFASLVANANPGSSVVFKWMGGNLERWPHNTGPMLTYMTSCGSTPCNQYNSTNAQWFKIGQVGRDSNGQWEQAGIMAGGTTSVTLPKTLAPGNYIIRHEIIALHLAEAKYKAEFYPACTQLKVGGTQNGAPSSNELVTFPGAYSDDDPGIWDKNPFDSNTPYVFPGPQIAAFVGTGTSSGGVQGSGTTGHGGKSSSNSTPSSGSPSPTSGPVSTMVCRLRRDSTYSNSGNFVRSVVRQRHDIFHAMRDLFALHGPS